MFAPQSKPPKCTQPERAAQEDGCVSVCTKQFVIWAEFVAFFNGNIVVQKQQRNSQLLVLMLGGIALEIELPMNIHILMASRRLIYVCCADRASSFDDSLFFHGEHNLIAANVLREWPIGIYSKIHSSDERRTLFLASPFGSNVGAFFWVCGASVTRTRGLQCSECMVAWCELNNKVKCGKCIRIRDSVSMIWFGTKQLKVELKLMSFCVWWISQSTIMGIKRYVRKYIWHSRYTQVEVLIFMSIIFQS